MRTHCEAGFTLLELVIAVALIALAGGAAGTFFLGGTTPVASIAARDMRAALDEAQRTAVAFGTASLVIAPAPDGAGFRARVYRGVPGDAAFAAQSGPGYEGTAAVVETAVPLGAPALAFAIGRRGSVVAYTDVFAGATAHACPPVGAFVLHVSSRREARDVAIPCTQPMSAAAAVVLTTPPPAWTPPPAPDPGCPPNVACTPPALIVGPPAACPPGTSADRAQAGLCDGAQPTPVPSVTPTPCPAGFAGSAPGCTGAMIEQYWAEADGAGLHMTTLFANGSICDDGGCSTTAAIAWSWGCAPDALRGSVATAGSNPPFQTFNPYAASVTQTIERAFHDAAQDDSSGIVSTGDSYCTGVAGPQ